MKKSEEEKLNEDFVIKALSLVREMGSVAEAARFLGVPRTTLRDKIRSFKLRGDIADDSGIEFPDFPKEEMPIEDVIDHMCKQFDIRKKSYDAHTWFDVKVKEEKPIGVLWIGDPHMDDSGCNWPALREHVRICAETEGMYGAMMGDLTNNWVGRLVGKYADQEASKETGYRLAEWLLMDSDIEYLLMILGNHDAWNDGTEILKRMTGKKIVCHDWEARFKLVFPKGRECRVHAAHDFKGHSMWNNMHGPLKMSRMGEGADLFVCGDKHNWGVFQTEHADRGRGYCPTLIRVRGYKFMDEYARYKGLPQQERGCSILTIIDPNTEDESAYIQPFTDIVQGAKYLKWLRLG